MILRIFSLAGAAGLLAGAAAPPRQPAAAPAPAPQQRDFHWSGRLANGEQLQVDNIVGDIHALPAAGDEVTVDGVRRGPGAERVRVEVVRRREGIVVCAIYPSDDRGWRSRDHDDDDDDDGPRDRPRDACDQRNVHIDGDVPSIDFTVRVPANVRLAARSVSGSVDAARLRGPVDAKSVSGNVRVSTAGPVEAASVSGDVFASMGRMGGEDVEFRSVSGDVTLEVPAGIDADFEARTLSGSIESDFPLQLGSGEGHGRYNIRIGQRAHATLGRGGPALRVTTVSGDVTLRRVR